MIKPLVRYAFVAGLIVMLAGCSLLKKQTNGTSGSSSKSTNPFLSSSKKVQQDVAQTETDFGQLQSEVKIPK